MTTGISDFLKSKRQEVNFTQKDLAIRAGVGLRFIRDLEQGKQSLRVDKVNQVLRLFNASLGVIAANISIASPPVGGGPMHEYGPREPYE